MDLENYCGGRSLDDTIQYWYSVIRIIKDTYSVNEAPQDIVDEAKKFLAASEALVKEAQPFVRRLNKLLSQG